MTERIHQAARGALSGRRARPFAVTRLVLHILTGCLKIATLFSWSSPARKQAMNRAWSLRLLWLCDVELKVHLHGDVLERGAMLVSNHVSWIDIYVINAWRPTPFVAKSEIASWPVIGWLAKSIGTVFIQRQRRGDAKRLVGPLAGILQAGGLICLFPEGTTSDGEAVLPFHGNLLQAAVEAGAPVQPLTLMYEDDLPAGQRRQSLAPAFVGDMSLKESLRRVLTGGPIVAHLYIGAALHHLDDRRTGAIQVHEQVSAALRALQSQTGPLDPVELAHLRERTAAVPPAVPPAR